MNTGTKKTIWFNARQLEIVKELEALGNTDSASAVIRMGMELYLAQYRKRVERQLLEKKV